MNKIYIIILFTFLIIFNLNCLSEVEDYEDTREIYNSSHNYNEGNLTIKGTLKNESNLKISSQLIALTSSFNDIKTKYIRTDLDGNYKFINLNTTEENYYQVHIPFEQERSILYENQVYEIPKTEFENRGTIEIIKNFTLKRKTTSKIFGKIQIYDQNGLRDITPYDGALSLKLINVDENFSTGILESSYKDATYSFTHISYGNYKIIAYFNNNKYEDNAFLVNKNENKERDIIINAQN